MGFSRAAKERGLLAIAKDGSWLGLATGRDGATLKELQDVAYRRQSIEWGAVKHGIRSEISNANDVLFPPLFMDAAGEIKEWFIITEPSGVGDVLATGMIDVRGYIDLQDGSEILPALAPVGQKDFAVRYRAAYPRPRAGEDMMLPAGSIVLFIKEES